MLVHVRPRDFVAQIPASAATTASKTAAGATTFVKIAPAGVSVSVKAADVHIPAAMDSKEAHAAHAPVARVLNILKVRISLSKTGYAPDIVFYSISTLARREMLWRTFVTYVPDKAALDDFEGLLARFKRVTTTRNKFAHAIYQLTDDIAKDSFTTVRFPNDFDGSEYIKSERITWGTVNEIKQTSEACIALIAEIQPFISRVEKLVQAMPIERPPQPDGKGSPPKTRLPRKKKPSPAARRKPSPA